VKQLNLKFEISEPSDPPPVALEQKIQAELVARLAEAITAVQQNEKDQTHEGTPHPS
jgi:hypothetical protein